MATNAWIELPVESGGGGGAVNSVTASGPLASSGGANPNISLTGVVPIANGGTGQNTANTALNALLPVQTGLGGNVLATDGTNATWQNPDGLITGSPNTFAGFDNTGTLYSTPWGIDANGQATGNFTGTLPVTSVTSLQLFPGITTPLSGGYEGIIVSPTLSSTMAFTSMFNSEADFATGFNCSGGVQIYQDQANFDAGATTQSYSSYGSFPVINGAVQNFTGFSLGANLNSTAFNGISGFSAGVNYNSTFVCSGGILVFQDSSNINSGATANNYESAFFDPVFNAGAIINNASGLSINHTLNSALPGGFVGVNVSLPTATGVVASITGLRINLNNVTDQNPQGVVGIDSDSRISINAETTLRSNQTFQIGNRVESLLHIPAGSPVTGTDSLGNDLAGDLEAEDNLALGPTGLGWISVGFIADMAVAVGKTVAAVDVFVPAVAFPDPGFTTGGSVTDMAMIRTLAPFSQGGTAVITNLYGFKIDPLFGTFSAAATNVWGLYFDDSDLQNYIGGRLSLGVTTTTTNSKLTVKDGHLTSQQTTAPTVTISANAGTGATGSVSNATDTAGKVELVTGTITLATGAQITVNFNKTYAVAPIVVITPNNTTAAQAAVAAYVTSTTAGFVINFAVASVGSQTFDWFYQVIETQ